MLPVTIMHLGASERFMGKQDAPENRFVLQRALRAWRLQRCSSRHGARAEAGFPDWAALEIDSGV